MHAINLLKRFATTEEAKKSRTCLCMSVALASATNGSALRVDGGTVRSII